MEIHRAVLDISALPNFERKILKALENQKNVAVKGGLARLLMLAYLIVKQEKAISRSRWEAEISFKDVDLIIAHEDRLVLSRDYLIGREIEIRQSLEKVTRNSNVSFEAVGLEPVQGTFIGNYNDKMRTIRKILMTRDLTINEIVLLFEGGLWTAYYTRSCYRDLIEGVGILTTKDRATVLSNAGRLIPTNYGFLRLFRFLVEGKVDKIWLPKWMIRAHLREIKRLQNKREIPEGANLGRYSLIISLKYKGASNETKRRWIQLLNSTGFTELTYFEKFVETQKAKYPDFEFKEKIGFSQVVDEELERRRSRSDLSHQRKQAKEKCQHKLITINCRGCQEKCKIKKCEKCNRLLNYNPNLKCNDIFKRGNWREQPESLMALPERFLIEKNLKTNKKPRSREIKPGMTLTII